MMMINVFKNEIIIQMPGKCYICLEECEDVSPCECGIPLHIACLQCMQEQMPNTECTICKSTLEIETDAPCKNDDQAPVPEEHIMRIHLEYMLSSLSALGCILLIYVCIGWFGKFLFWCMGIRLQENISFFWTIEHLTSFALGLFSMIPIIAFMQACCERV